MMKNLYTTAKDTLWCVKVADALKDRFVSNVSKNPFLMTNTNLVNFGTTPPYNGWKIKHCAIVTTFSNGIRLESCLTRIYFSVKTKYNAKISYNNRLKSTDSSLKYLLRKYQTN